MSDEQSNVSEQAELEVAYLDIAKETTQTQTFDIGVELGTPDDCLEPPENLDRLAGLTRASAVRRACIEAIALNTVGLGYTLGARTSAADPHQTSEAPTDLSDRIEEAEAALESAAKRDTRLDGPSFSSLLKAVKYDEEEVGQGYLEVSRDRRTGQIDGLYHGPSARIRRRLKRDGYVLLPPDGDAKRGVRYDNYGTKVEYDAQGRATNRLTPTGQWSRNELLPFKLYSSESRDYGMPRDVALSLDYLADKLATDSNVSFFDSSGTPPTILFVGGVESRDGGKITFKVPQETSTRIANTLRSDAGHKHRVAVIPVPPGTKAESVQLGETSERDMGFNTFRDRNAHRALGAFRLQPIFVPFLSEGARYDAEVQRAITLEQVFDPEQDRYEQRLTATLLTDLGFDDLAITFKRMAVEGDAQRRESAERMAEVGAITYGEFREAHGYKPLAEGEEIPAGWNKLLIPVAKAGPPAGAENRVNDADDQRGLRPGIGGRVSRDKRDGQPRHVEAGVTDLSERLRSTGRAAASAAASRARSA